MKSSQAAAKAATKNVFGLVAGFAGRMGFFVNAFADCFNTRSAHSMDLACRYEGGLLSKTRGKNMERMDERLGSEPALRQDSYQAAQQFVSTTRRDESLLYARIARRAGKRLDGTLDAVLGIDESSHAKKGKASVGVARQRNGRLGKEDNCQTGVYSGLNCGTSVCLTGCRLYLPGEWIEDPEHFRKAGVPGSRIGQGHVRKIDLARELIDEAIANGLVVGCVAMDDFDGPDSTLRRFMEERGLTCCVNVPANARLFTEAPTCTERPRPKGPVTKTAAEVAAEVLKRRQRPVTTIMPRPGDDGDVKAQVCAERVWEWTEGEPAPTELWLVIRRMPEGCLTLSLCNAGRATSPRRLAGWQAGRLAGWQAGRLAGRRGSGWSGAFRRPIANAAWRGIRPDAGWHGIVTWRWPCFFSCRNA